MNQISAAFLALLRAGLRNSAPENPSTLQPDQWRQLLSLAKAHKVLPLIFEPALPLLQDADPALAAAVKGQVRQQVIGQTLRTAEFLELYRALEEAGAAPVVVKGIVCRSLYPKPDHRPSGDEDLWVSPEEFPLCCRVMTRLGMTTDEPDPENAWELSWSKAGSPLHIELHKQLFSPGLSTGDSDFNDFFGTPGDHRTIHELHCGRVRTMHPTDHMTYLLFHAFKHFLHSGFGIRQICDILLFAHHHNNLIDWAWVQLSCRSVRAEKFAAAVFAVGVRHLGFSPIGPWPEVDEMPLLEDVLRAGVYGSAQLSRLHSSTITLEAAATQKRTRSGVLAAAFPPARKLEGRYPWLKGRPYLLPAAWGSRIITYLRQTRSTPGNTLSDALKIGTERLALLKQYDILK